MQTLLKAPPPVRLYLPKYGEQRDAIVKFECEEEGWFRLRGDAGSGTGNGTSNQASSACAAFDCDTLGYNSPFWTSAFGTKAFDAHLISPSGPNPDDDDAGDEQLPQEGLKFLGMYNELYQKYAVQYQDYEFKVANWGLSPVMFGATVTVGNVNVNENDVAAGTDYGIISGVKSSFRKRWDELKRYPLTSSVYVPGVDPSHRIDLEGSSHLNGLGSIVQTRTLKVHVPVMKLMNAITQKASGSDADLKSHGGAYSATPSHPSSQGSIRLWIWCTVPHGGWLHDFEGTSATAGDTTSAIEMNWWHGTDGTQVARWTGEFAVKPKVTTCVRLYDPIVNTPDFYSFDTNTAVS